MRTAPALLVSAALVTLTLSGCSSAPSDCLTPGDATEQVSVSGDLGSTPTVSFPTPLYAQKTQAQADIVGDGERLEGGEPVVIDWSIYDGRTGKLIEASPYDGSLGPVSSSQMLPGMARALECQTVGSRVVAAVAADDALGPAGGRPDLGVNKDDTLIIVLDIERAYLAKANGADVPVVEPGFPSVVTAPDGTPGLTIPKSDAPTTAKFTTLKRGDGATVTKSSTVIAHMLQASWNSRTVSQSTWSDGTPRQFAMDSVPDEVKKALIGSTVGSQLLVLVPSDNGDATIYVIDVLGVD
ncbi:peptidylprolyl isomerase [Paramicrobacterium humi]|uniref:peptidylprolyl isomerase n=1 Tax=Paramicrobacterium humi TaxID=640635 RepID=A0A1H4R545_9MICO|nr:hypothetical protein [Microbacterium humi]SEC26854.1 peptidylprolyl isomerase [Microbacterium humi]